MEYKYESRSRCANCGKQIIYVYTILGTLRWFHEKVYPQANRSVDCRDQLRSKAEPGIVYGPSRDPLVVDVIRGL